MSWCPRRSPAPCCPRRPPGFGASYEVPEPATWPIYVGLGIAALAAIASAVGAIAAWRPPLEARTGRSSGPGRSSRARNDGRGHPPFSCFGKPRGVLARWTRWSNDDLVKPGERRSRGAGRRIGRRGLLGDVRGALLAP